MSWFAIVLGAALFATGTWLWASTNRSWASLGHRRCPSCLVPLEPLGTLTEDRAAGRAYEVLVCPSCTNAVTCVHGARSSWAYCPSCRQRTLETPLLRLPDGPAGPRVEVHERCHLCEHRKVLTLGEPSTGAKIIPFPRDRRS